jgi:lipopolysaccharide cholinephosphotransferase
MYQINEEELKELQQCSLKLLCRFREFCKMHDLKFFLSGGSCLGAVRHHGFIPWDDDVDLLMPRDDYERLEELWNRYEDTDKYAIVRPNSKNSNGNKYITIHDNNTTFIELGREKFDTNQGVALEILPLDGYPNEWYQRKLQLFWAIVFSLFANNKVPGERSVVEKLLCYVILKIIFRRSWQYKIFHFAEKRMSKYKIEKCKNWAVLCTFKNIHHKYKKEMFIKEVDAIFEKEVMPIPYLWDEHLKILYGDYMKLPPKEEQVHKHECVFLDLYRSYIHYRGIYYLAKNERRD